MTGNNILQKVPAPDDLEKDHVGVTITPSASFNLSLMTKETTLEHGPCDMLRIDHVRVMFIIADCHHFSPSQFHCVRYALALATRWYWCTFPLLRPQIHLHWSLCPSMLNPSCFGFFHFDLLHDPHSASDALLFVYVSRRLRFPLPHPQPTHRPPP